MRPEFGPLPAPGHAGGAEVGVPWGHSSTSGAGVYKHNTKEHAVQDQYLVRTYYITVICLEST